MILDSR